MNKLTCFAAAAALATLCLAPGAAFADDEDEITKDNWPMAVNDRPLTLAAGMIEIAGNTLVINMSDSRVAKPISLAPSVFYGVNRKLSVGVTHSTGICISSEEDGCFKPYNDFGVDARYSLMHKGSLQVAAHGGLLVPAISDTFVMGINVGAMVRLRAGKIAIIGDPTLYIGAIERDAAKELLAVPLWVKYQLNPEANVFLSTGLFGPLDGFGDANKIPVGLGGTYTLSNRIDVGAEFSFTNLAGKDSSADLRELIVRAALRI